MILSTSEMLRFTSLDRNVNGYLGRLGRHLSLRVRREGASLRAFLRRREWPRPGEHSRLLRGRTTPERHPMHARNNNEKFSCVASHKSVEKSQYIRMHPYYSQASREYLHVFYMRLHATACSSSIITGPGMWPRELPLSSHESYMRSHDIACSSTRYVIT